MNLHMQLTPNNDTRSTRRNKLVATEVRLSSHCSFSCQLIDPF